MFNPIIVLTRNNLQLTKRAIQSFQAQDVYMGTDIIVVDNDSTDGTIPWLIAQRGLTTMYFSPQIGVAAGWNRGLQHAFKQGALWALVCNNDVELRPDTYRILVEDGGPFVTAVGTKDPLKLMEAGYPDPANKRPHPDFSCFLIRRHVYEKVGPFDEKFELAYCEDSDYHVRMHQAGIEAYALELPFFHLVSQTINNATPGARKKVQLQADKNREYFKRKHGFEVASKEYYDFFKASVEPGPGRSA